MLFIKLQKCFIKFVLVFVAVFSFVSCEDDDSVPQPAVNTPTKGAYIINQGNSYTSIAGSISFLDYSTSTVTDSVFYSQNGILPGNTLQCGIMYGSHFYAIAFDSNVLFVCDRNLKLQKTVNITSPRALATDGGYLYISNYDGHVSKVDTITMDITATVEVGSNPEEMAVANGYLYVVNSDGMNYTNNYANGKSVSKIKLSTFTVEKTITVGLNPTKVQADAEGNIFIIAMGDYATVPSTIQKISVDDQVTNVAEANLMCINNDTLYAINSTTSDWINYQNTYFSVLTTTLEIKENILSTDVEVPIAIAVDPTSCHIFVTSFKLGTYGPNYNTGGYMKEFDSSGIFLRTYSTGVNPVQVIFR